MLQNNQWFNGEIKEEIKNDFETNEYGDIICKIFGTWEKQS